MWVNTLVRQTAGKEASYLHWNVCYGGGSQVEVLLDQNVEFGGEMPPRPNTVNFAGEQRRDLRQQDMGAVRSNIKVVTFLPNNELLNQPPFCFIYHSDCVQNAEPWASH